MPSLSPTKSVRDSVFHSFADFANRRRESWVLDAMRNLNHPLRQEESEEYIVPGLALAEEIQKTGDIFFPLGWLNALLEGHSSTAAAQQTVDFLESAKSIDSNLRGKMLQASDGLFRAAHIVHGWNAPPSLSLNR
jgi:aminopeptidase N